MAGAILAAVTGELPNWYASCLAEMAATDWRAETLEAVAIDEEDRAARTMPDAAQR